MQEENSREEIRLEGKLKSDIRPGKNENYCYVFMFNEEQGRDVPLFFFKEHFEYEKWLEVQSLTRDQHIVVYGFERQTPGYDNPLFQVKRLEAEEEVEDF